jgi:hypothetical protein
MLLEFN